MGRRIAFWKERAHLKGVGSRFLRALLVKGDHTLAPTEKEDTMSSNINPITDLRLLHTILRRANFVTSKMKAIEGKEMNRSAELIRRFHSGAILQA